jgi:cyanoexosortase B-associated protein
MKIFSMSMPKSIGRFPASRLILVVFLGMLVIIGAVPSYLQGNWSWAQPPEVKNLSEIRSIRSVGLDVPGIETLEQQEIQVGGHKWSAQEIAPKNSKPVLLLLLPQRDHKAQPEVEWLDINGFEQWKTDSYRQLRFQVPPGKGANSASVNARFFRAWNQRQTFAVVQWYATPHGGTAVPSRWFWADQLAQLRRRRVPWVAVSLKIPMEPLGDLEASQPLAQSLGESVQTALMSGPLARPR